MSKKKKQQQQQQQSLAYRQRRSKNIIRTIEILRYVRWQIACAAPGLRIVYTIGSGGSSPAGKGGGGSQKISFSPFGPQCGLKIRGSPPPGSYPGSATDWYTMQRFRVTQTQANGQVQRLKTGERSLENNNRPKKEANSTE